MNTAVYIGYFSDSWVTVTLLRRIQAVQWLRRLVAGLLSWWPMFDPRPIHVTFMEGKVALNGSPPLVRVQAKEYGNIWLVLASSSDVRIRQKGNNKKLWPKFGTIFLPVLILKRLQCQRVRNYPVCLFLLYDARFLLMSVFCLDSNVTGLWKLQHKNYLLSDAIYGR